MVAFHYKIQRNGTAQTGTLEADSLQEASAQLRRQGGVVLRLRADKSKRKKSASDTSDTEGGEKKKPAISLRAIANRLLIARGQRELTLRQLGSLLTAGVPILTAIRSVGEQAPYLLKHVYDQIAEKVRRGYSLERCLKEEAPFLGPVTIGLIAVGEANGTLENMLTYSAELMHKAGKIRAQIIQAFTYPAIVVVVGIAVAYYLVAYVFPQLMVFIQKQGGKVELPRVTRLLIEVNDFATAYGLYIMMAPVLLVTAYVLGRRSPVIGEKIDYAKLQLPLIGKAFREHANAMWCQNLGSLLGSGVDVIVALQLVEQTIGNMHYSSQFRKIREVIRQGGSLGKGLRESTLSRLCPIGLTMVSVSEESGGLDTALLRVSEYSEERLSRRVGILGKLVEPAIFLVVGGMVGFVYFAFFMAMLAVTRSAT